MPAGSNPRPPWTATTPASCPSSSRRSSTSSPWSAIANAAETLEGRRRREVKPVEPEVVGEGDQQRIVLPRAPELVRKNRHMTSTLPQDVRDAFERFITCELTTVDAKKQPITWPVTPYYKQGGPTIDVTTGLGYPKKADDARAHPERLPPVLRPDRIRG